MRNLPFALPVLLLVGCPGTAAEVDSGVDAGTTLDTGVDASSIDAPVDDDAPEEDDDAGTLPDGSILPPRDSGDPFGDTGTLTAPDWVPIDVVLDEPCPQPTPCGGDVVGTWDVAGGCISVPSPTELLDVCPGATFEAEAEGRGRVTFDGSIARRTAQSEVRVHAFVPTLCAAGLGGCEGLEDIVQTSTPDSACVTTADGCICEGRVHYEIDDGDGYTIEGSSIVSATLMKRWDYCIEGDLTYYDVSEDASMREPGVIRLTPRGT